MGGKGSDVARKCEARVEMLCVRGKGSYVADVGQG